MLLYSKIYEYIIAQYILFVNFFAKKAVRKSHRFHFYVLSFFLIRSTITAHRATPAATATGFSLLFVFYERNNEQYYD